MSFFGNIRSAVGAWWEGRSIEDPSVPLSDWEVALGGKPTASGVKVGRKTALMYSPVWRAFNLLSGTVAKLPTYVYERTGTGRKRATAHAAYPLLRNKPNGEMTAFVFKQTLMGHALLEGNGLAYIFRRGDASPEELIPLTPEKSFPCRENGRLVYVTELPNGEWRRLLPENVLHLRGIGYDGLTGYRLLDYARESLGVGIAAEQYGGRFFRNNAEPSVVIEHPKTLSKEASARLKAGWNKMHQGLDRSHRAAVLEEGAKVSAFSSSARNAQLMELRGFEVRSVANWFGVPPHKLGDTTKTSYASLEQENQAFLDESLDCWLVNFEEEMRDKLLTEEEKDRDTHYVEFLRNALVRADLKTRAEYYAKALGGQPWETVDEVRGRENLDDLPDGEGKKYVRPLNMTPAGDPVEDPKTPDDKTPPPPPVDPDDDDDEDDQQEANQ